MLSIIVWLLLLALGAGATLVGMFFFLVGRLLRDKFGTWFGAIVLVCGITCLYNTSHIAPFSVHMNPHVMGVHK